jgi:Tfp pilus assembly protein PilF
MANTGTSTRRGVWSSKLVWATAAAALLIVALFGRTIFGGWARFMARRDMDAWAISSAQEWLRRAQWLDSDHPETYLLAAKCYRYLGQSDSSVESLEQARVHGARSEDIANEVTLGQMRTGSLPEEIESSRMAELTETDLSPHDIAWSYIDGRIAQQDMDRAYGLLQAWEADFPGDPHINYVRGMLAMRTGDNATARDELTKALELQPRHELAQIALAELADQQGRYAEAIHQYIALAGRNPDNAQLVVGLARVLRKAGRVREAREVLAPILAKETVPAIAAVEAGEIELEAGQLEKAKQWFQHVPTEEIANHSTLTAAAMTLALLGQNQQAERAFQWIFDEVTAVTSMHDLQTRLQADPDNNEAAEEFRQLLAELAGRSSDENPLTSATSSTLGSEVSAKMRLYAEHCEACHGPNGLGDGRAARHLYPRPRNLRHEKMRLVSTRVGIPTVDDITAVIRDGIPGTSMTPLDSLHDVELMQLAEVVREMRREGVREQYVAALRAAGDEVDPEDVAEVVAIQTDMPGPQEIVTPPTIPPTTEASLQLGKELYRSQTCDSCHGDDGTGDESTPLFDDLGRPSFPRDLVHDYFKGGNDAESIYLRLRLGMPGSPHPANVTISDEELIALVHYCQSLAEEPKHSLTNHQRAFRATSRPAWMAGQ